MADLGGRYTLESPLGSGNYGTTYLARDLHKPSHPLCVVKQLRHQAPKILTLFHQEAVMLEKLGNHPQIPALIDYFSEGDQFYIVQDYIEGHDLRREIQPRKILSEGYVLKLLRDVLTVLSFVHRHRVIHRDIKPANLVRRKTDGQVFLIDFGTVKQLSNSELDGRGRLRTTVVVGTDGYMPPEQEKGHPCLASDLYALGMVALEALSGGSPHRWRTDPDTRERQWPEDLRVSEPLARFLAQLTRRDPQRRFRSAPKALAHFIDMLPQLGAEATVVVAPGNRSDSTLPPLPLPWQLPVRPVAVGAGAVLAGLSLWGLGGMALNRWQQRPTAGEDAPEVQESVRYPAATVDGVMCVYADCSGEIRLRASASDGFWAMQADAADAGVMLVPLVGFQELENQQTLWVDLPEKALKTALYHSDYHTGYGLALGDGDAPAANRQIAFEQTKAFAWLQANAAEYGFAMAYPKGHEAGYQPWRWRYVGDETSQQLFQSGDQP